MRLWFDFGLRLRFGLRAWLRLRLWLRFHFHTSLGKLWRENCFWRLLLGCTADLNVIGWHEAIFSIKPYESPLRVGTIIVDKQSCIIRKGQLLISLSIVIVKSFGMVGGLSLQVVTLAPSQTNQ